MTEVDREIPKPETKKQLPAVLPAAAPQQFLARGYSQETWEVLSKGFFPSAKSVESIMLVTSYCAARKLDLMLKPFHIVPVWSSKTNQYEDGVWPSITLYEITAHRTGEFAGVDEAVYSSSEREFSYSGWKKKLPEYCTVTVYRLVQGVKQAFTSERIYFEEFVGIGKNGQPNDNWGKKSRYMMSKCAKAAALRMAFPEEIGSLPTAEEMDGQMIGGLTIQEETQARAQMLAQDRAGDYVDGEVIPSQQEVLEAAAITAESRGNQVAAESLRECAEEAERITSKDSLALMKAGTAKGLKGQDVLAKIGELVPRLNKKSDWASLMTRTEYELVMADIERTGAVQ